MKHLFFSILLTLIFLSTSAQSNSFPLKKVLYPFEKIERARQDNIQREKEKNLKWPSNKIIGKTIKIGNMEVAEFDFPEKMKWRDVDDELTKLGKDWRIPTMSELKILYENKEKIDGFSNYGYWSSTTKTYSNSIFGIDFKNGYSNAYDMYSLLRLRAIRTDKTVYLPIRDEKKIINTSTNLKMKSTILIPSEVIGNPIKIQKLAFAQFDFPNEMNWQEARIACAKLGDGWRLPFIHELNLLYENKNKISGFVDKKDSYHNYYWSSTEGGYSAESEKSDTCFFAWNIDLEHGNHSQFFVYGDSDWNDKHNTFYVRAVKSDTTSPIGISTKISVDDRVIEVAQYDFPDRMNWADAKTACEKLGDGWRLPDYDENREIENFNNKQYRENGTFWGGNFNDGKNEFNIHHVRPVRNAKN